MFPKSYCVRSKKKRSRWSISRREFVAAYCNNYLSSIVIILLIDSQHTHITPLTNRVMAREKGVSIRDIYCISEVNKVHRKGALV